MSRGNMDCKTCTSDYLLRAGAFLGATGISAGAFGAHALKKILGEQVIAQNSGKVDNWRTAVLYQLMTATSLLALSALEASTTTTLKDNKSFSLSSSRRFHNAGFCMVTGNVLFSGSIYALTLGIGPKKILGPITPLGGLLMIGGWTMLGFSR